MNAHVGTLPISSVADPGLNAAWANLAPCPTPAAPQHLPESPSRAVTEIGNCRVEAFSASQAEEWDQFVRASRNGTIFHEQHFLGYHPQGRFQDASLMVRRKGQLVAVFPAVWRIANAGPGQELTLHSHAGASYGGPVFAAKAKTRWIYDAMSAVCQHAALCGASSMEMRLPPHVFHSRPLEELEFVLRALGFDLHRRELSTYVELPADGELLPRYDLNCRNAIHKAQRLGLTGERSQDLPGFWQLLAANLASKHQVSPTHSLGELLELRDRYPERVLLFAAADQGKMLAATLVLHCNRQAAHTFYMASDSAEQPKRPLNLAVHAALNWAQTAGIERMNFGVSTPGGTSVNWGLLSFKESFGGQGTFRDTYRLTLGTPQSTPATEELL